MQLSHLFLNFHPLITAPISGPCLPPLLCRLPFGDGLVPSFLLHLLTENSSTESCPFLFISGLTEGCLFLLCGLEPSTAITDFAVLGHSSLGHQELLQAGTGVALTSPILFGALPHAPAPRVVPGSSSILPALTLD